MGSRIIVGASKAERNESARVLLSQISERPRPFGGKRYKTPGTGRARQGEPGNVYSSRMDAFTSTL
ncbi:hypothetical protein PUN28_012555 [Cardiocondyla obscurior]|uniref:Uncharacterized protein n=1 Tax=Cardiocondyla obscurior TaxID=286306 RepID=A0AAW2FHE4_9HYME